MSDIQEKKDAVLKKLTKAQQKKLSLQEQINYYRIRTYRKKCKNAYYCI